MKSSSSADVVGSTDDLLLKILMGVKPKPVVTRLKLVSKHWKSLITTLHARKQSPLGLICPDLRIPFFDFVPLVERNLVKPPFQVLRFPCSDDASGSRSHYWISDSCNGLLLLCHNSRDYYSNLVHASFYGTETMCIDSCCVYNPTTKCLAKIFPRPGGYYHQKTFGLNLAFDPTANSSYKIVCARRAAGEANYLARIEIYSSESRQWRLSSCKPFSSKKVRFNRGAYWNGSMHWIDYSSKEMLRFDVDKEELVKLPLPPALSRVDYFGESMDHLHIVEMCGGGLLDIHEMKKDYSGWFLRYRIDMSKFSCCSDNNYNCRIFSFVRGEGEKCRSFLFFKSGGKDGKFILCNVDDDHNTFKELIGVESIAMDYAFQYIESHAPV